MDIRESIRDTLKGAEQFVGFAESCTGGLLSSHFLDISGMSEVFVGSVVSYSNEVKIQTLGVDADVLAAVGAVSEEVARQMAQGLRVALNSHWAVSTTGIAGPGGGTPEKPVGTVWISVLGPDFDRTICEHFDGDRNEVRMQTVQRALELLRDGLCSKTNA